MGKDTKAKSNDSVPAYMIAAMNSNMQAFA